MASTLLRVALAALPLVAAQQIGKTPERHPKITSQYCTKKHGCKTLQTSLVLDALSHPIQDIKTGASCNMGSTDCTSVETCAKNCAIEGVDYAQHGVKTSGDSVTLHQYLQINGILQSVSPRLYLLDPTGKEYEYLKLLNQEISFTVDASNLPCGMNGALYMSSMDQDGGRSRLNPAGATYGTGYCDAQCFDTTWINGVANFNGSGSCCNEMDLWEANARATALTPHACNITGLYECEGDDCGADGVCDKNGCGFNPYGLGAKSYYGLHNTVDTTKPFTVTTQFITDDNTATGTLSEIRRLYVQNGKVIQNANVTFGSGTIDSITDDYCDASSSTFTVRGGLAQMGDAIGKGMVLIFSIWNDAGGYMNWLDADNSWGAAGPCNATEGNPTIIEATDPSTSVTWSAIKWGDIGTTYKTGPAGYHS